MSNDFHDNDYNILKTIFFMHPHRELRIKMGDSPFKVFVFSIGMLN